MLNGECCHFVSEYRRPIMCEHMCVVSVGLCPVSMAGTLSQQSALLTDGDVCLQRFSQTSFSLLRVSTPHSASTDPQSASSEHSGLCSQSGSVCQHTAEHSVSMPVGSVSRAGCRQNAAIGALPAEWLGLLADQSMC